MRRGALAGSVFGGLAVPAPRDRRGARGLSRGFPRGASWVICRAGLSAAAHSRWRGESMPGDGKTEGQASGGTRMLPVPRPAPAVCGPAPMVAVPCTATRLARARIVGSKGRPTAGARGWRKGRAARAGGAGLCPRRPALARACWRVEPCGWELRGVRALRVGAMHGAAGMIMPSGIAGGLPYGIAGGRRRSPGAVAGRPSAPLITRRGAGVPGNCRVPSETTGV